MRRYIIILISVFLIVISTKAYSQDEDTACSKKIVITTTISDYIPTSQYNTANINIGTEVYLKHRKSLWFNLGLVKKYKSEPMWGYGFYHIPTSNLIGFKAQGEYRYYLNKHKVFEPATLLFWPHIFQFDSQDLENSGYYVAVHSSFQGMVFDSYYFADTVNRNITTLNIKLGYQCVKKIGLIVDFAIGIGGRYIFGNPSNEYYSNQNFWGMLFNPQDGFSPNTVFQFRLGWGF